MQHAHCLCRIHNFIAKFRIFWGILREKFVSWRRSVPQPKNFSQVGETSFGNELYVHGPAFQLTTVVAAFFSDLEKDERHERNISVNEFFLYTFFLDAWKGYNFPANGGTQLPPSAGLCWSSERQNPNFYHLSFAFWLVLLFFVECPAFCTGQIFVHQSGRIMNWCLCFCHQTFQGRGENTHQ